MSWRLPALPTPHNGQKQLLQLEARIRVGICGRRFGKTWAGALAAIQHCTDAIKRQNVWWVAPVLAQAHRVEREIADWLVYEPQRSSDTPQPFLEEDKPAKPAWKHARKNNMLQYVPNGSRLEFKSAHVPDRLRGEGLDLIIVDEAADITQYAWNTVLKPMLLDRGGKAFILGTPRGTRHWLHDLYNMGLDWKSSHIRSLRLPTIANPRITQADLDEFKIGMTEEEYLQEYGAEFIAGAGAVFSKISEAISAKRLETGAKGAKYITGIDLADRVDYTVLCSINMATRAVEGFARFNRLGWDAQLANIRDHLRKFPGPCIVDVGGPGDPIVAQIRKFCEHTVHPFTFTPQSKEQAVRLLSLAFDSGLLAIPDIPELIGELQTFQSFPSGRFKKYTAPPGLHDDCVMALCMAWWMAERGEGVNSASLKGIRVF